MRTRIGTIGACIASMTLAAAFTPSAQAVDYKVKVFGAGRVYDHLEDKRMNCGSSVTTRQGTVGAECDADYPNRWGITFTPEAANDGWRFAGWQGRDLGDWGPLHCDFADESHWLAADRPPERPYPSRCTFATSVLGDPNWSVEAHFEDVREPGTELTGGTSGRTGPNATVSWTFKEPDHLWEGSSFECRFDNGNWFPCSSGQEHSNSGLPTGEREFSVRAKDPSEKVDPTPATTEWYIDRHAPDTAISNSPPNFTRDPTARFSFNLVHEDGDDGGSLECKLDAAPWEACGSAESGTADYTVGDGRHTFLVRGKDSFDNVDATPAEWTWTVDTSPPDTAISSGLDEGARTGATTVTFGFSSEAGAGFECRVDGAAFGTCSGPGNHHTASGLGHGTHVLDVRAVDGAGNVDPTPARRTWTVDTVPPDTAITSGPGEGSTLFGTTVAFAFASEPGAAFECRRDADPFGPCSGGDSHVLSGLTPGVHTFEVRSRDGVGNADPSPATRTFTIALPALTIGKASVTGKWKQSKLKRARLEFAGNLSGGNPGRVTLTLGGRSLTADVPAGAFAVAVDLPRTVRSRLAPGNARLDVGGTSNGLPIQGLSRTVRVPAPREGVVVAAKMSTSRDGPSLRRISSARKLWATFRFAPAGKPTKAIRAHWSRNGKRLMKVPAVAPRAFTWLGDGRRQLAKGRYACALKMGKKVIKVLRVRVG